MLDSFFDQNRVNFRISSYPSTGPPVNYLHLVTFLLFIKSTSFDLKAPKKFDLILLFIPVVMLGLVFSFFF